MTERKLPRVPANVIKWDNQNVSVLCPFCEEVHLHGFLGYLADNCSRSPRCQKPDLTLPSYKFRFPFNERTGGFEIDKEVGCYCIPGRSGNDPEAFGDMYADFAALELRGTDDQNELRCNMGPGRCPTPLTSNIHVLENGSPCGHTIDLFISSCLLRNLGQVTRFLQSGDPVHFVKAKDRRGNPVLNLVAMEGHKDVVQLLHSNGAAVDEPNNAGRTALMEAALWGRWSVFRYLFEAGGDIRAKDQFGRCVKDFADDTKRNRELRKLLSSDQGGSRWDAEEEAAQRRIILSVLATEVPDPVPVVNEFLFRFITDNARKTTVLQDSIVEWEVDLGKTIGILIRPEGFPRISTHSGWIHDAWTTDKGDLRVLSGNHWTTRAMKLAQEVGYKIKRHQYDRGSPGRYHASHAETQLMAFFVSMHVFLPIERNDDLQELAAIEPDHGLRSAKIFVNRKVCRRCEAFKEHLNNTLDICITLTKQV